MRMLNPSVVDLSKYQKDIRDEASRIKGAAHFATDVMGALEERKGAGGLTLPWSKTHQDVRLRDGELFVWAGKNGHGKSLLIGQVLLSILSQGGSGCELSLEMPPKRTVARLVRQACGSDDPSPEFVKMFNEWTDGALWLYDRTGTLPPATVVALARYTRDRLGVTDFVVDSLMKIGIAPDDWSSQTKFVDQLAIHARDSGQRIHLVVHPRKTGGAFRGAGSDWITADDIRGPSGITDLADNVILFHRNKRKEAEAQKDEPKEKIMKMADAYLTWDKQRHGEWTGTISLWYHNSSMQYVASQGDGAIPYYDTLPPKEM